MHHIPYPRALSSSLSSPGPSAGFPIAAPVPHHLATARMHVKRVTLTSKKNWWMVEMDDQEDDPNASTGSFASSEETAVSPHVHYRHRDYHHAFPSAEEDSVASPLHQFHHKDYQHTDDVHHDPSPPPSPPIYNPPRHPTSIFSFPTPTAYCAPPNPTASLAPCAQGSASELFKCVVKKPDVVQLEINGEMQSNAADVTVQFLAELRVYTTLARHRNIAAFLGCLENVGMVLEYIEGRTLYDVVKARPEMTREQKIDYHNQLLDGLTHLHSYGLSHGDLSLSNVQVTSPDDTIKLLDFGRSVSADSVYTSPDDEPPEDSFQHLGHKPCANTPKLPADKIEQIHPGTRPFSAPEVLRGECQDARLADAYSFGMILVCLDRCESVDVKPWEQRMDIIPADLLRGCLVFEGRVRDYLKKWDQRKRLLREDLIVEAHT